MSFLKPEDSDHAESVLLVDDNPTNLQVLLGTLNGQGYKLLVAKNGESAIRIAQQAQPSLILLDIMMPNLDGYEVCQRLKQDPATQRIAIIFLSALNDTKDKVYGLSLDAVDFISKPFQADEVIARVKTQLKIHRLEEELYTKNKQLEADKAHILSSMQEGVLGLDLAGNISFANTAAEQMLMMPVNGLVGKNILSQLFESIEPEKREPSLKVIKNVLDAGVLQSIEEAIFWKSNGDAFFVYYSCSPLWVDKKLVGAVLVFTDITEKKQNQEALTEALKEVSQQKDVLTHVSRLSIMGEMAAGFAHEVNQPLTAIANYAQVAKRMIDRLDDQSNPNYQLVADAMTKINTQARRAGDIISRIRTFVRKPNHILKPFDTHKLLNDTCKLAEIDSRNNGVEIHLEAPDQLPNVYIDCVQIQQVLLNLIRNAMEAMKHSKNQHIGVKVIAEIFNFEYVKISVIDRGCGLADDAEEKLFLPFYTTKEEGMGIGLSVCASIIHTHGGELKFKRHPEGGTIFEFTVSIHDN